jgi:hypothetical protein
MAALILYLIASLPVDQGHFVLVPCARKPVCLCISDTVDNFSTEYHLREIYIAPQIHPSISSIYAHFPSRIFTDTSRCLIGVESQLSTALLVLEATWSLRTPTGSRQ